MLLLAFHTTVVDLPATATQPENGEKVFPLSTRSTRSIHIAASLMIFETLRVTQPGGAESTLLLGIHASTVIAGPWCSFLCRTKLHRSYVSLLFSVVCVCWTNSFV